MARKSVPACVTCGKTRHMAMRGPAPWRPYLCPLKPNPHWWGKTAARREDLRCAECGWSAFVYANGAHISEDGVRGYRCMNPECGAIKPEDPSRGEGGHLL